MQLFFSGADIGGVGVGFDAAVKQLGLWLVGKQDDVGVAVALGMLGDAAKAGQRVTGGVLPPKSVETVTVQGLAAVVDAPEGVMLQLKTAH